MHDLTGFQRGGLAAIAGLDDPTGLGVTGGRDEGVARTGDERRREHVGSD